VLRSTADQSVQWTASVLNPPHVALTVEPAIFTFSSGATQAVIIRADATLAPFDQWLFGRLILQDGAISTSRITRPVIPAEGCPTNSPWPSPRSPPLMPGTCYYGDSDCPGGCAGDFDPNGTVDEFEFAIFTADHGRSGCP
jgi:hypothetical protein